MFVVWYSLMCLCGFMWNFFGSLLVLCCVCKWISLFCTRWRCMTWRGYACFLVVNWLKVRERIACAWIVWRFFFVLSKRDMIMTYVVCYMCEVTGGLIYCSNFKLAIVMFLFSYFLRILVCQMFCLRFIGVIWCINIYIMFIFCYCKWI